VSVWVIPHQNLFQSPLTLLGFVSLAVLFQGDQWRPRGLPMGIYFNRNSRRHNQFQPQLAASLFPYLFRNENSLSEQMAMPS
jgi:hypothetical protein